MKKNERQRMSLVPSTTQMSLLQTFSLRQEYNSFKIMSSRFNSVLQNFKSFRNYADISYVNASYHMHVFYSRSLSLFPAWFFTFAFTLQTMA